MQVNYSLVLLHEFLQMNTFFLFNFIVQRKIIPSLLIRWIDQFNGQTFSYSAFGKEYVVQLNDCVNGLSDLMVCLITLVHQFRYI